MSRRVAMSELVEYAGPWIDSETVQGLLGIDSEELARQLIHREMIGCVFLSGRTYFPAKQLMNGRVVDGLHEVLEVLASGDDDPETWAVWMAGSPADDGITNWERLRAGRLDLVLTTARRHASRWSQ